jgi:asparagine synthase (glutamine-hydrolysing)
MLNPKGRFSVLLQDMLRGSVLASMPFFDQKKVVSVLDGLQTADESSRVANDQTLMMVLSACVLHDRFRLSA